MQFDLLGEFVGQPLWLWAAFLSFVVFVLWLDLSVVNKDDRTISAARSATMWASFAFCALLFGGYIYFFYEPDPVFYSNPDNLNAQATVQYFTGYLLETALAFDNIFVITMVFAFYGVPPAYQHRVLFWGILGAIVFRAIFIGLGAAIVNQLTWVLYVFAAILIFSGWKMLTHLKEHQSAPNAKPIVNLVERVVPVTREIHGHNFLVRLPDATGRMILHATPLLLALVTIEMADIIFAIDSVPAIFAVTRDPFIVYTSNIFAVLGLRSMYFMLASAAQRFVYLKLGLAAVLILIGGKIIWNFLLSKEMKLVPYLEAHWSLLATLLLVGGSIIASLWTTRGKA
ncbi:MAG TPA: TerC/Alx family metal homeostasis membrane protein [Hyphomonadaceae bacterium]|jgi:tellurite resistance protein TerC